MPASLGKARPRRFRRSPAPTDTAFLTVMLDVTANLLCTAIILLVLSLAIDRQSARPVIEQVAVVMSPVLAPAGLVAAFRARAGTVREGLTIDLDQKGVTVKRARSAPGSAVRLSRREVRAGKLAQLLAEEGKAEVLIFIFDQTGYGAVWAAIDEAGLSSREIDVPLALRSAADPQSWSKGFQSLFGLDLDAQAFQARLQQVLVGEGNGADDAAAAAKARLQGQAMDLAARLFDAIGFWWRLTLVGAALLFMIRIRRRPYSGTTSGVAE